MQFVVHACRGSRLPNATRTITASTKLYTPHTITAHQPRRLCSHINRLQEQLRRYTAPLYHKFTISHSLESIQDAYKSLEHGEKKQEITCTIAGRVRSRRESSKKLIFYDLEHCQNHIQVVSNFQNHGGDLEQFNSIHSTIKRGDIIGCNRLYELANMCKVSQASLARLKQEN